MTGFCWRSWRTATRLPGEAYIKCRNQPEPRLLHEFRKKSKTFLYQLVYFRHPTLQW
ncbi:MAG: hypothetical protein MZV63_18825 [Marinilabiliales bacterium]|nr:hypothetical protein [Marinilabiliales bacterium]